MGTIPRSVVAQTDVFEPSRISISGSIIDNYANLTYGMDFDNTASDTSKEVDWFFGLQDELRLSNISVFLNGTVYWGHVIEEEEAISTYEEEIEANHTAVLVTRRFGGYSLSFNVENGSSASLQVFVEGLLTREMGLYSLEIPLAQDDGIVADFEVDITLQTHYGDIAGYYISGITTYTATPITSGIRVEYSASDVSVPTELIFSYALERQTGGSQLLTYNNGSQNFFVYLLAPSITTVEDAYPREYVFVLDTSGSMSGDKIQQAKTAFSAMIDDMSDQDIFNVVAFSTEVHTLWIEPYAANTQNKETAKDWVNGLNADGSTNFYGAGVTGLDTFTSGSYSKAMLILSDGQPTCGVSTLSSDILSAFQEANTQGVSISTVAFGVSADTTLMANVASQNDGFFEIVQPGDEAVGELLEFYKVWSMPLASGYTIYVEGEIEYISLRSIGGAPFFNGSELVITGRYESEVLIETSVDYADGIETYSNTANTGSSDRPHIERMWAQQKISWLVSQAQLEGETPELRTEILQLALQYGLVVNGYTGMILITETSEEPDPMSTEATNTDVFYAAAPTNGGVYPTAPGGDIVDYALLSPISLIVGGAILGGGILVAYIVFKQVIRKTG